MKPALLALGALVALALIGTQWGAAAPPGPGGRWSVYIALLYGTGLVSVGMMAGAMLLALRTPFGDRLLGGLDRCYRAHRWMALIGLGFGLAHYLLKLGSRELRRSGWLEKPHGVRSRSTEIFDALHDPAKLAGEIALYAGIALAAVALLRLVPYRAFEFSHRLMAAVFLLAAFHAVVFMPADWWSGAPGPLSAILIAGGAVAAVLSLAGRGGAVAAVLSLAGRVGARRRAGGTVADLRRVGENALEIHVKLDLRWRGHRSGQFAFVTFDPREGAHPFTIASAWRGDGHLMFVVNALGDYTRGLPGTLKPGDPVVVEGPYGAFDYDDSARRQIWIAGGVGLTPFIARLEELAARGGADRPTDLFFSARRENAEVLARLERIAEEAGVRLHASATERDGHLTAGRIMAAVPEWRAASVWFCGPAAFGDAVRHGLDRAGLDAGRFRQEAFAFR